MFYDYKAVAFPLPSNKIQIKSPLCSDNTSKRKMSGGVHLRGLALGQPSGQHSMKKRRSGGDPLVTLSVYGLTGLEVEPLPSLRKAMSLPLYQPAGY